MDKEQAQTEARNLLLAFAQSYRGYAAEEVAVVVDDSGTFALSVEGEEPSYEDTAQAVETSKPGVWVAVLRNGDKPQVCVAPGVVVAVF